MFVAAMRNCIRARSPMRKYFMAEKSKLTTFGPRSTLTPELPKRPTFAGLAQTGTLSGQPGTLNAFASKNWLIDWPDESFPLPIRSGRAMKLVLGPRLFVFEGSKPENVGV